MTVQTELNRNNRNSTILAVGVAIVAMSISLLLSGRAARCVTRQIRDLCDLTEKVAGGDFSVKTQVEAGDEIAVLTRSFNDMTEEMWIDLFLQKSVLMKQNKAPDTVSQRQ